MVYSEGRKDIFRTKFTPQDLAKKYGIPVIDAFFAIEKELERNPDFTATLEDDVDIWFPLNYSEIWEC